MAVKHFPCIQHIAEQNTTQNVSAATQNISFATRYWRSLCTKYVESKYFAKQNCLMKSFPEWQK